MDIGHLDKAEVLAALYNAAKIQGGGAFHAKGDLMPVDQAQRILDESKDKYFDYLFGRVMKVDLSQDKVDPWLYNRDNGEHAFEKAIQHLMPKTAGKTGLAMILLLISLIFSSCSENYSNGNRVGTITRFSKQGHMCKSWEGHLNVTQTGMNSGGQFEFSIDNDNEDEGVIASLDSALQKGWIVDVTYHEVAGLNWLNNRGETDYFVTGVKVLERDPTGLHQRQQSTVSAPNELDNKDYYTLPILDGVYVDSIIVVYRKRR
jgi:hypothetical protein